MSTTRGRGCVLSALLFSACTGTLEGVADTGTRVDAARDAAPSDAPASPTDASIDDVGAPDAQTDAGPVDPCGDALLCEPFEGYDVTTLDDGQRFGPWRASLRSPGATMDLDGAHTVSGARALHMRIDAGANAGGRIFANGALPIFEGHPTHIYGRLMMFIEPNGTSVHWTLFGASGDAEPSSPVVGRRATYMISSLPRAGVNTYSFVDGLEASATDPFHDCWFQGMEPMPTSRWTCIAFEMDGAARHMRLATDGAPDPTLALDDHGQGCVGDVVPGDSPWYGPAIDQLYVGAYSFHPMDAPLEVWIDDLVVDTSPVACPAP